MKVKPATQAIARCPHCKAPSPKVEDANYVHCDICEMFGPTCQTKHAAIEAWNRLSLMATLIREIETHLDSPLWLHEFDSVNEGWSHLRAMMADYREAAKG